MGLLIVLSACVVIVIIETDKEKGKGIDILIVIGAVIIGLASFLYLMLCNGDDSLSFKYNKETLKEVIQLEELEANHIFVNYSYSTKEYSYKVSTDTKKEMVCSISTEDSIVQEQISKNEEIRIEHYKLTNPKSFWIRYIPWITADKYIIYAPEGNMISRTN